jgi:PIN domain nuclease of toxin-antitoxin system
VPTLAVADAHSLIWYGTEKWRKLGKRASRFFADADRGRAVVYVPTIALVEIAEAHRRGVIHLSDGFSVWCRRLLTSGSFFPAELTVDIVLGAEELYSIRERGDRLIAATALVHDLPLVTRDSGIGKAAGVDVLW